MWLHPIIKYFLPEILYQVRNNTSHRMEIYQSGVRSVVCPIADGRKYGIMGRSI